MIHRFQRAYEASFLAMEEEKKETSIIQFATTQFPYAAPFLHRSQLYNLPFFGNNSRFLKKKTNISFEITLTVYELFRNRECNSRWIARKHEAISTRHSCLHDNFNVDFLLEGPHCWWGGWGWRRSKSLARTQSTFQSFRKKLQIHFEHWQNSSQIRKRNFEGNEAHQPVWIQITDILRNSS